MRWSSELGSSTLHCLLSGTGMDWKMNPRYQTYSTGGWGYLECPQGISITNCFLVKVIVHKSFSPYSFHLQGIILCLPDISGNPGRGELILWKGGLWVTWASASELLVGRPLSHTVTRKNGKNGLPQPLFGWWAYSMKELSGKLFTGLGW